MYFHILSLKSSGWCTWFLPSFCPHNNIVRLRDSLKVIQEATWLNGEFDPGSFRSNSQTTLLSLNKQRGGLILKENKYLLLYCISIAEGERGFEINALLKTNDWINPLDGKKDDKCLLELCGVEWEGLSIFGIGFSYWWLSDPKKQRIWWGVVHSLMSQLIPISIEFHFLKFKN